MFVLNDRPKQTIVPICARLNLSLPFWRSFEPVASFGLGTYWTRVQFTSSGHSSFQPGAHLALALLFTGEKRRYGLELAAHARGDEVYSGEVEVMATAAGAVLFR